MAYGVFKDKKTGIYQQDTTATYETLRKRVKCSLKTENKRTADERARQNYEAAIDELERDFRGLPPKAAREMAPKLRTFWDDDVLPWGSNEYKNRERTWRALTDHMSMVLLDDAVANTLLDAFDEDVIDKLRGRLVRREYSGCTINHAMGALRQVLRLARRWSRKKGYRVYVPDFSETRMKENLHERVVEADEEALYVGKCNRRHFVYFKLLINTGMEPGYAAALQWADVHLNNTNIPHVHDRCKKTDTRERDIPMTEELRAVLLEWWMEQGKPVGGWVFPSPTDADKHCPLGSFQTTHKRIFGKSLRKNRGNNGKHTEKMRHLMKEYGLVHKEGPKKNKPVEYFRLYDLRHTFLTRLGRQGRSATVIAAIAGWSSTRMALRYVHHDLEDKAKAIASLNQTVAARS
jgi:integrase